MHTDESKIITLCGSTRFEPHFKVWNIVLSLVGHTVFTVTSFPSEPSEWLTPERKADLDAVHKRKIDRSDYVLVINAFAYIGESTLGEIKYAESIGKGVIFTESWGKNCGLWAGDFDPKLRDLAGTFGIPKGFGSPIRSYDMADIAWQDLLGPAGSKRNGLVEMINKLKTLW